MASRASTLGLLAQTASILAFCALAPDASHAHAPPQVLDILWTEAQSLVLVTNRGLIFGPPVGERYRLLCNEALHSTVNDTLSALSLRDGRVLVATYRGLIATGDEGCTWQAVEPLGDVQTTALEADDEGQRMFVASYAPGSGGIWRSDDQAASFEHVLETSDVDFIRSMRVARPAQGELTVYASGSELAMDGRYVHYVRRSLDAGDSWERFEVPLLDNELDLTLLAVSATDARVVVAKATSIDPLTMPERLLISRDGGESFASPFAMPSLVHAELSSDGTRLWVAGLPGLFRSDDFSAFVEVEGTEAMTYVSEREGVLYIAGRYAGFADPANGIATMPWMSDDVGSEPASFLELRDASEPVHCELGTETAYLCETPWLDWQREVLDPNAWNRGDAGVTSDAGATSDAGTVVDASTPGSGKTSHPRTSSCAVSPSDDASYAVLLACVGLLVGILHRRWKSQ